MTTERSTTDAPENYVRHLETFGAGPRALRYDPEGFHTFALTRVHLTLLRSMYVGWCRDEFGAPEIDPKRPYGNSDVIEDIARILGVPDPESNEDYNEGAAARLRLLHDETETALQIVLATGRFEPGVYQADQYSINWRKVGDAADA